jgi:hypothetical protein
MSTLFFLPQAAIEGWTARGAVDVEAGTLTVQAGSARGQRLALEPAVRFLGVAGAGLDPNGLVGKVKSLAELRAAGAELLGDSVLLGETAYDVQQGFTALAQRVEARSDSPSPREKARNDAAELARFLLGKLP